MERIHAYIDESGAYGFDFSKSGNTSHFIITAVTVKESDIAVVEREVETIKKENGFDNSEMKSSKIKTNFKRRLKIIEAVKKLPLKAFVLVIDKRLIYADSGIRKNKKVFYKFLNEILYEELRRNFNKIVIEADATGTNSFQAEFYKYVQSKEQSLSLFDESEFSMTDSKLSPIVQIADLISGSLSYYYEEDKKEKARDYNFKKILSGIILLLKEFPKQYDQTIEEEAKYDPKFNRIIFEIAYRRAQDFIKNVHSDDDSTLINEQKFILEYLLFRFC